MRVFLALPERGLPDDVRETIEAAVAERHEALPPLPEWRTGLAQSERNRFLTAVDRLMEADLLVADVSEPSHDVAWCLAWFLARGRLAVLTCRRPARAGLGPMVAGNPSPWQRLVTYDSAEGLREALRDALG